MVRLMPTVAALTLLALCSSLAAAALAQSDAEAKATSIARDFAARVGAPVSVTAEASVLPPDNNWPGAISIEFDRQVTVEIDTQSGKVVGFSDHRVANSAAVVLDVEAAKEAASRFLDAAGGFPSAASLESARLVELGDGWSQWWVFWRREIQGYRFPRDGANLIISPDTGALIAMGIRWYSQPPASLEVKVTREHAIALARDRIGADLSVREAKLMIAHPEMYQQPPDEAATTETNLKSVLAWYVYFDGTEIDHVVLNATDGTSVGETWLKPGAHARAGGPKSSADRAGGGTIRGGFQAAVQVELIERRWSEGPDRVVAVVRKKDAPGRLARLVALVGRDQPYRAKHLAPFLLKITGGDGRATTFEYVPQARMILDRAGTRRVSATVGPAFHQVLCGKRE